MPTNNPKHKSLPTTSSAAGHAALKYDDYHFLIDWQEFGKVLKQLRTSRNMTQIELSSTSGVNNTYISQIESGQRENVSADVIEQLAVALKVKPKFLMFLSITSGRENKEIDRQQKLLQNLIREELKLTK